MKLNALCVCVQKETMSTLNCKLMECGPCPDGNTLNWSTEICGTNITQQGHRLTPFGFTLGRFRRRSELRRIQSAINFLAYFCTLSTDLAGELDVLGQDGDALGLDGAQVGVLEETDHVSLSGLRQGHDS